MASHVNKQLFNRVHAFHHQQKAILDVRTTAFDTWADAFLGTSPPLAVIVWLALWMGSYWAMAIPLHTNALIFLIGERGGWS